MNILLIHETSLMAVVVGTGGRSAGQTATAMVTHRQHEMVNSVEVRGPRQPKGTYHHGRDRSGYRLIEGA